MSKEPFGLYIYEKMREQGLVTSKRKFATDWLGKVYNYMITMNGELHLGVLFTLWMRLTRSGNIALASEVFNEMCKIGDIQND